MAARTGAGAGTRGRFTDALRAETLAVLAAGCASRRIEDGPSAAPARADRIDTVTGPIAADRLGVTLMHEHVLVDFIGAAQVSPSRYDANAVFAAVLPHLQQVRRLGCETLVECTPAYLGRDPRLLKRLSQASGVHILSNTGYYGAAQDKHLPPHAFDETAEQLSARWIREWQRGIDDTGIKPAFMKIGVDGSPLSAVDAKLVRAAARAELLPRFVAREAAGATEVVPESLEGSLMMGSHLLLLMGVPVSRIVRHVRDVRTDRYRMLRGFFHGEDVDEGKDPHAYQERLHSITLPAGAYAVGKLIADVHLEEAGVSVSAVRRGGIRGPEPSPETKLTAGDVLVLYGSPDALEQAEKMLMEG